MTMTEADTPSCAMDDSASGWEEKCWSILEGIEMYASTRPKRLETTGQVASPAKAPTAPAPPRSTGTFVLIELAGDRPTEFFAGSASFRGVPLFSFFFSLSFQFFLTCRSLGHSLFGLWSAFWAAVRIQMRDPPCFATFSRLNSTWPKGPLCS